ncbi:MAG: hypothetical protein KAG61_06225 [Bacteriovoracaceae bacterium]|nr:hypothetical protein [Bacteriovoracaceae bacterium]
MSNRLFDANSWINGLELAEEIKGQAREGSVSPTLESTSHISESEFAPSNCFVPGWTGQSLFSNDALDIAKTVTALKADARTKFQGLKDANPTLHSSIFNEFLEFANTFDQNFNNIAGEHQFWHHIYSDNSPYKAELETFIDYYTHRIVVVYLFKLKFVALLGDALEIPVQVNQLINTSSFLMGIFRPSGSTELNSKALKSNQYSWYRPSKTLSDELAELSLKLPKISITETMKISTYRHKDEDENLVYKDKSYSHAISHQAFGFFINHILINFPKWINKENGQKSFASASSANSEIPNVVSCKFQGNHLNSFILSHWLAQKACIEEKWDQLICPDCVGNESEGRDFIRLCHELQLICYLVKFGKTHNMNIVSFICKVMKDRQLSNTTGEQLGLFQSSAERNYDRIVVNTDLPKANPHHHLLNKINKQTLALDKNGFMYVLTNQKLFVPSQKGKIEQLFKELKLEGYFNFENLNGRGEIPQFLYVFSKRPEITNINDIFNFGSLAQQNNTQKETCFTFRMSGELKMFSHFMDLVDEMSKFFKERTPYATPFYQAEPVTGLNFEFYQDAIVDGTLHSITRDSETFTHPAFFANINKSCIPMEQVFKLENLEDKSGIAPDGLFGPVIGGSNRFPFLLIINLTDPKDITLELTSGETYLAKKKLYGTACFHYYGLVPKLSGLNINLFKEYFESELGTQIIQLCLSSSSKLKSQINSLLVPEFFAQTSVRIPEYIGQSFDFLSITQDELQKKHPKTLAPGIDLLLQQMEMLSRKYPWDTMGRLCFFKHNIECCLEKFKNRHSKSQRIDFSNPQLFRPLAELKPIAVINHDDIEIRPLSSELQLPLDSAQIVMSEADKDTERLVFKSGDQEIVEFYSSPELLRFIRHIVSKAQGAPIGQLIGLLQVPSEKETKSIVDNFRDLSDSYSELYSQIEKMLKSVLSIQIS